MQAWLLPMQRTPLCGHIPKVDFQSEWVRFNAENFPRVQLVRNTYHASIFRGQRACACTPDALHKADRFRGVPICHEKHAPWGTIENKNACRRSGSRPRHVSSTISSRCGSTPPPKKQLKSPQKQERKREHRPARST